ncbi:MAG: DUF4276 family protein, partial [Sedimenticola sp.]
EFSIKKFVGNGCGKLRSKCGSWASMLSKLGCEHIMIFHDRDRNDEKDIRHIIETKVCKVDYPNSIIVIPVEELEAWLLADAKAIKVAFNLKKAPKKIGNCEAIESPKEFLRDVVWNIGKKRYLNTMHNKKIAEHSNISNFLRCKSYRPFDKYVRENICL